MSTQIPRGGFESLTTPEDRPQSSFPRTPVLSSVVRLGYRFSRTPCLGRGPARPPTPSHSCPLLHVRPECPSPSRGRTTLPYTDVTPGPFAGSWCRGSKTGVQETGVDSKWTVHGLVRRLDFRRGWVPVRWTDPVGTPHRDSPSGALDRGPREAKKLRESLTHSQTSILLTQCTGVAHPLPLRTLRYVPDRSRWGGIRVSVVSFPVGPPGVGRTLLVPSSTRVPSRTSPSPQDGPRLPKTPPRGRVPGWVGGRTPGTVFSLLRCHNWTPDVPLWP